ncbi:MAG TPA: site-2 protease family protein [Verrucomicrobiota bacterium]|nr:site-2 protease family protein [Verrucomicrobiota bacterium]HNT15282.1 site-2 protease family protein [Verrucomicrobiota bacterium]
MPTHRGSIRIFSFLGIGVYLHWSWFLVALYGIYYRTHEYSSLGWNGLEYLSLFSLVLLHEFGHQLACRQVGGTTHDIILWPLGGVAYVSPPQRPGAQLWSIAAGPLVNVALTPVLLGLVLLSRRLGWDTSFPDVNTLLHVILYINVGLLIFNLLPIYPLDGGQILRSLLWYVLGRAHSLQAASIIGLVGAAGIVFLAIAFQSVWIAIMAVFLVFNCWRGLQQAMILAKLAKIPRRAGYACPSCQAQPPAGALWHCGRCGQAFDTFVTQAVCPRCGTYYDMTQCLDCGTLRPFHEWIAPATRGL